MEFLRQVHWSGLPFPTPGDLPDPRIEPASVVSTALAGRFSITAPPGVQFSSVAESCLTLCNPWTAAGQASLSITNFWSLLKLMSNKSVIPSSHLILCHPLLLLPSFFPNIKVFSNEPVLRIRWPNIGVSASASILPKNIQDWFPLGLTGWISLQSKGLSRFSNTTV